MANLKEKLKDLPKQPGVYEFKNKDGVVLYVGKAKNLKNRVNQYFNGHDTREQIPYLMAEATDFDYTVVNTELESLFLENTLIKQYLPRYNIMLRDDKNYAFIKIDYSTEIPQIVVVRKVDHNQHHSERVHPSEESLKPKQGDPSLSLGMGQKARFFGPYTAAYKIRSTLNLIRRIFPYCSAQTVSSRPCFYYYLHRCQGVCIGKITIEEYKQQLDKICDFLSGRTGKVKQTTKEEMKAAARNKLFEKAARLRDQLQSLEILDERQTVILAKKVDWDIISVANDAGYSAVNLFKVRDGKLFDKENFIYELDDAIFHGREKWRPNLDKEDVIQSFLEKYYLETSSVPKIIYPQNQIGDAELVQHIIKSRFDKKIEVTTPQKGKPKELAKLGQTNAQEYLKNWLQSQAGHLDKINNALIELKDVLKLEKTPERIECYDISNIQGTNAVGSMVVFEKGLPKKSEYRKFRIKTKKTPDDFAMMKEMLSRRLSRSKEQEVRSKDSWPMPDLIVIDGGKGQLSAALEVLEKFSFNNFQFSIIGLAKRIEEIFLPENPEPITLSHDNPALQLLQRLRDEAHRFGITYHRELRSKQAVRSALDDIPGIGPATKKLLKQKFGTVANIRRTKFDDLAAVVGERIAQLIAQSL